MRCPGFWFIFFSSGIWCFVAQPISDAKFQCRKYDFYGNFNISVEDNIVIVYNSALCRKCLQKLDLFKSLQVKFEAADFKELTFIMLTTELNGSSGFADLQSRAGNITVISLQDINNDNFVPESIYVFDKCSRLTYELVPPMSNAPKVVKAAVLSTWYDNICGSCEFETDENTFEKKFSSDEEEEHIHEFQFENTQIVDPNVVYEEDSDIKVRPDDSDYIIPLKIIIPVEHVHKNDSTNIFIKHNFVVLNFKDNTSHEHLANGDTEILLEVPQNETKSVSVEERGPVTNSTYRTNILTAADGTKFEIMKSNSSTPSEMEQVKILSNAIGIVPTTKKIDLNGSKNDDITASLKILHPWLSFRLISRNDSQQYL